MVDGSNLSYSSDLDTAEPLKRRYVFLYPDVATPAISQIDAGEFPKERLTGYYQLKQLGVNVAISDGRWKVPTANFRRRLSRYVHLPSFQMLKDWARSDVVVIKDKFSFLFTILAKVMRKKIVYLDTMFQIPRNRLKRMFLKQAIRHSDLVISLSKAQSGIWARQLGLPESKFKNLYYSMDCDFYSVVKPNHGYGSPLLISIGRDTGRDFHTLCQAVSELEVNVELITLPYLLPDAAKSSANITIREQLSYAELLATYSRASIAVVPLKSGIDYPSGIRAVMEAMLLGVPVVASYTPVLAEYFTDGVDLLMVEPENQQALQDAVQKLLSDAELRLSLRENARQTVCDKYNIESYGVDLAKVLRSI